MFKFLIVLFFLFIILMALAGFSVIRMFKNFLFGTPEAQKRAEAERKRKDAQQRAQHKQMRKKKIISEDEGEYVDYEEVK